MTVIGLVGEKGGGKGTFSEMLAAEAPRGVRCAWVRFSDLLRETLDMWSLPHTRQNLQELSRIMNVTYGSGTLANATRQRIARCDADIVVLDGVRWEADRALIRSFPQNLLVYVTARPEVRYARIRGRGENADDARAGLAQFMAEEQAVAEIDIPRIGATADIRIVNEGTVEQFRARARSLLARVTDKDGLQRIAPREMDTIA